MTEELKPCPNPFCKKPHNLVEGKGGVSGILNCGPFRIWCKACGLFGPTRKTLENARTAWNTRITEQSA